MKTSSDLSAVIKMIRSGDRDQHAKGEGILHRLAELDPPPGNLAEILHYCGLAAMQSPGGPRDKEAADFFHRAIEIDPTNVEFYGNLGSALGRLGREADALLLLDKAIELKPDYAHAHSNRAVALQKLERLEEATLGFERSLELDPAAPAARRGLASVLNQRGFHEEAAEHFRKVLETSSHDGEAREGLAHALRKLGKLDESLAEYRRAALNAPENAEAHNNLGICLLDCGDGSMPAVREARISMEKAVELSPNFADAHWNLSLALLALGEDEGVNHWERGWLEYEWRKHLKSDTGHNRPFNQPAWNGCAITGRNILLTCEQGLGDTIQFVRYAKLVSQQGAKVILESPPPLLHLLKGAKGIDRIIARGEPLPPFDLHVRLMSLPGLLRTSPKTVPADVPYIHADPARVEKWRQTFNERSPSSAMRVGICWQGSKSFPNDSNRSMPLRHFAPLAAVPGVSLFSLQKGTGSEQIERLKEPFAIETFGPPSKFPPFDEAGEGAFLDTAAIMMNLDLVITSDTAIAHLAGALGVRVWVAIGTIADWRWMLDREDSPWYPTMRLFRQRRRSDWDNVFERMAMALGAERSQRPIIANPVTIPISHGELFDRITILQIKSQRLPSGLMRNKVREELALLLETRDAAVAMTDALMSLHHELKAVNEALWQIEDDLRLCEAAGDKGDKFVELARSVYKYNHQRSSLKNRINILVGSALIEAKLYKGENHF